MKVAIIGKFGTEEFGWHIKVSLEAMGHQVIPIEFGFRPDNQGSLLLKQIQRGVVVLEQMMRQTPSFNEYLTQQLLRQLDHEVELTIVTHDFLTPDQAARVRTLTHAPLVLWFPDAISQIGRAMFLNAPFDFLFFKDTELIGNLRLHLCKPAYYLPECCNPEVHYPVDLTTGDMETYGCDIVQAGNMNTNRLELFRLLASEGKYHIKLWGNPPPLWADTIGVRDLFQNRFVAYEEKSKAFRGGKVLLNNLYPGEVDSINARAFEGAGIGAFQLITRKSALPFLFEEDEEIVSYGSYDELLEKVDYYLAHPEERRRIGNNAHLRAFRDHTYRHRLELLLATVAGTAHGYEYEY